MRGEREVGQAEARARAVLHFVKDPEVPVLSVVELGIVRDLRADDDGRSVTVTITPTYSGCPAMKTIEDEITAALKTAGFAAVTVETVYAPAWTTEWMTERAREKLRAYGIAPPGALEPAAPVVLEPPSRRAAEPPSPRAAEPPCPLCGATDTVVVSEFGATACKSLHLCRACRQPFEHFKAF